VASNDIVSTELGMTWR